ncbi:citrate-binding protein [Amborella trichopoda]|uniref:Alginate lyase 2 domain-containing protein n=1 Tax=Amborella trichopoda TaxID=13333 RepID=W1PY64_AMBTC|nr:citrate-binding protein [Amborella trichopoda]ERN12999.1 hypothetical protein AMTR_s00040p00082090 [Amborella trichopoda]|eukprot:XP_006851418.1 citrate-binding protein [Amborella trichopoda]
MARLSLSKVKLELLNLVTAFLFVVSSLIVRVGALQTADSTYGFTELPLHSRNLNIQRPYDVAAEQRFSFCGGVYRMWVFADDKPHTPTSNTKPRTEIRISGYDYSSGLWQFEGHAFVPNRTTGVTIMQIKNAVKDHAATTLQLRIYNGQLMYYGSQLLASHIYDRWFKLNVIHDMITHSVIVLVDGVQNLEVKDQGGSSHYFKFGVYGANNESYYMESWWKDIKIFKL